MRDAQQFQVKTTTEAEGEPVPPLTAGPYLVLHGPGGPHVVTLADGDQVIAGRSLDARLRIDHPKVSREHAVFRRRGAVVELVDLGSRNGTWLDGQPIAGCVELAPGAVVRIGPAQIAFAVWATAARAITEDADAPEPDVIDADTGVVVTDLAMRRLYTEARRVARSPCSVLITGETGSGKEVVAEHLHRTSPRAREPFIRLNCAALPESLLESELFGYERGAFSGADRRREGWIEAANRGTLFLDEIGEMPLRMQAKLLRVMETGRLTRLGTTVELELDLRLVCATHRDLAAEVEAGTFRADLYYRLAAIVLQVPPLRDRPVEILQLAARFVRSCAARMAVAPPAIDAEAAALLQHHPWPGNVRELKNTIERAVALCRDATITAADLPSALRHRPAAGNAMRAQLDDAERRTIAAALAAEHGNQTRTAHRLGISRRNLVYKLTKYDLR
ncbi:MAG TPA: sigma 54-interacting transcriptional regulator [Kofleriaceae bacterium]|nr:sigma 54-interacting transcriptional regulator [Kofleriaceae bacterium]